jgi:hypothetical protein
MSIDQDLPQFSKPFPSRQTKHPRSLLGQIRMLILQPGLFFRTLATSGSQMWFLAAILILGVIGASGIRQQQLGGPDSSGNVAQAPDSGTGNPDISTTWTPALIAISKVAVNWVFLSLLLMIVSLSRSKRPQLGQNLRMVVWASLPLGLMAGLQLLFFASGGSPGKAGLSGLTHMLPGYDNLPTISQDLITTFSSYLTVFGLWTVILVYLGARNMLNGSPLVVIFVIVLWCGWMVIAPVAATQIANPPQGPLPTVVPLTSGTQAP